MQLQHCNDTMYFLHYIVIMLHIAGGIKPGSSAILTGLSAKEGDANVLKNQSQKERMTVPRILNKSKADSKSLSFAFTLPVQRKTLQFNSNLSRKQFRQPFSSGLENAKKDRQGDVFKKVLNEQRGGKKEGNNARKYNNSQTFQMVGEPLTFNSPMNKGVKTNKSVNVSRESPNIHFGTSMGSPTGRPKIEWKGGPPSYEKFKGIPQTTQIGHKAGGIPLDEEIIVMGEPLIFTNGGPAVSGTLKYTAHDVNVTYGTQGSNAAKGDMQTSSSTGAHYHKPALPVKVQAHEVGVQGVQVASQSSDRVDFQNKTTIQNDTEWQLSPGPKYNLNNTYDYLPKNNDNQQPNQWQTKQNYSRQAGRQDDVDGYETEGVTDDVVHNFQNKATVQNDTEWQLLHGPKNNLNNTHNHFPENNDNQKPNQWQIKQNNSSPAGRQEDVDGYEAEGVIDDVLHNNKSINSSSVTFDEESLKQGAFGPSFQVSEQNQTEVIYENGQEPENGHYLEDSTNGTNYLGNDTNEQYGNPKIKNENADQLAENQGNPSHSPTSQEESVGSKEEQTDTSEGMNDDGSNLEQNQETKDDEQLAGSPVTPVSNQRYMPVDEFGSPFYGNESDDYFQREALAAHNKYRVIHRAPPLVLNQELSREAQHFANQLAKLGVARHEVNENLRREWEGDNVARGCSEWGGLTASGAVHRWYTQVCSMDWNKRTIQPNTKNFLQLIWKGTSHMGIGRAFGMRKGFPCTFIVARYRPGVINSYGLESNIDKGLFLPSYCNAEKDEGLMSTGFPSSFFLDSITGQRDESRRDDHQPSSTENAAGPPNGIPLFPLRSWEKNIDSQDVHDLLKQQAGSKAAGSFLPRINLAENKLDEGKNQDEVTMEVDDGNWKRSYKPLIHKSGTQPEGHNNPK